MLRPLTDKVVFLSAGNAWRTGYFYFVAGIVARGINPFVVVYGDSAYDSSGNGFFVFNCFSFVVENDERWKRKAGAVLSRPTFELLTRND